jgi:drug/metabolite transporter (DMT)-like permease
MSVVKIALVATICYTAYILCARATVYQMNQSSTPVSPSVLFMIYGGGVLLTYIAVMIWWYFTRKLDAPPWWKHESSYRIVVLMVLCGVVGSLGAYFVLQTICKSQCAAWTSLITLCLPVVIVSVVSVWLFGERINVVGWGALVIAVTAIGVLTTLGIERSS